MRTISLLVACLFALCAAGRTVDGVYYQWCCDPIPTLVCQTGVTCDLQLSAGDRINPQHPVIADMTQWLIYADGGSVPQIYFEPLVESAHRTLVTIPRENDPEHPYHVWVSAVRRVAHPVYAFYQRVPNSIKHQALLPTPEPPLILHGQYRVTGRAPFQPTRIGNDGLRTYVFLPRLFSYPVPIVLDEAGHETAATFAIHVLPDGGREYIIPGVPGAIELSLGGGKRRVFLTVTCLRECR